MNNSLNDDGAKLRLRSHCVHMDNRGLVSVTGVTDVGCFNESEAALVTECGAMVIEGSNLHILKLDLEDGQVSVEGEISALVYEDEPVKPRGSLLSRLFR